jgi:hypothetical protein
VLDAVFNQRLQQDAGHQNLQRARIDLLFHAQLVGAKAHHFDVEVVVGKAQLLAQRNVGVVILEQRAQNVGQLHRHLARHLRLHAHQRGNGVERVEQKVRIDLALQRVEPGLEQQPLLLFKLHLDAQRIPHLERDAHTMGALSHTSACSHHWLASSAKSRCGKAWASQSRQASAATIRNSIRNWRSMRGLRRLRRTQR